MARQKNLQGNKDKVKEANQELRSQVRQLRKQLHQALRELESMRDIIDDDKIEEDTPATELCKHCHSDKVAMIRTKVKTVVACLACGKRYTMKEEK